jgi:hypothetical protein
MMTKPKDPVTLSGGVFGGEIVEGDGWIAGEEKTFTTEDHKRVNYRRIVDDGESLTEDMAIFTSLQK